MITLRSQGISSLNNNLSLYKILHDSCEKEKLFTYLFLNTKYHFSAFDIITTVWVHV